MPKHWIADLEVTEYPRKGRPSSFCFLDVRAPGGCISKSLLKGECLETRVRSELAALEHLAQGGERLYARPLLALATLPNPNPQRSVPPSQACLHLHLSRTSLTTSRSSAGSIQARRRMRRWAIAASLPSPRSLCHHSGAWAANRLGAVPIRFRAQSFSVRAASTRKIAGAAWRRRLPRSWLLVTSPPGSHVQCRRSSSLGAQSGRAKQWSRSTIPTEVAKASRAGHRMRPIAQARGTTARMTSLTTSFARMSSVRGE